jgi:hypothetical protein
MGNIDGQQSLAYHMHKFSSNIKAAINKYGIVNDPTYGRVYAYEVDGFGSGEITWFYFMRLIYSFHLFYLLYVTTLKWLLT